MLGKDQSRWQERWLWLLVLVGALRLGVGYTYAQEARGQLPNGLNYIIRHNAGSSYVLALVYKSPGRRGSPTSSNT